MKSKPAVFHLTNPAAFDGKVPIMTLAQLLKLPAPTWLIEGLVPHEAMVGLAGPPGVGKSMLALDWALCVATGRPWLGHACDPGFVLYIAAEGHTGLSVRAKAWLAHHQVHPARVPFGLVKGRISIQAETEHQTEADYDTLFKRIDEEVQRAPKFVIIDTLARCLDGDENTNEGMGSFLDGAERLIDRYKSTVLVIHHKNAANTKERGHTSFRGTLGSLFFFEKHPRTKEGLLVLKNEKQRDAEQAADIGLKLVESGTSVLLNLADLPARGNSGDGPPKPPSKASMLTYLAACTDGLTFTEWMRGAQVNKNLFTKRLRQLTANSEIYKDNGRYFTMPSTEDLAEAGDEDE